MPTIAEARKLFIDEIGKVYRDDNRLWRQFREVAGRGFDRGEQAARYEFRSRMAAAATPMPPPPAIPAEPVPLPTTDKDKTPSSGGATWS
jgi:hypothetical protein